jgi:hypothetical protein
MRIHPYHLARYYLIMVLAFLSRGWQKAWSAPARMEPKKHPIGLLVAAYINNRQTAVLIYSKYETAGIGGEPHILCHRAMYYFEVASSGRLQRP